MNKSLDIVIAQMNPVVGDLSGNVARMLAASESAGQKGDLVLFPELSLTGYSPGDLLHHPEFAGAVEQAESELLQGLPRDMAVVYGRPEYAADGIFNVARLACNGSVLAGYRKRLLPNYGVFDEERWFHAGDAVTIVDFGGFRLGLTICEDLWQPGPFEETVRAGADAVLNLSASPWALGKGPERIATYRERIAAAPAPLVSNNLLGGQDRLVFDGASLALNADGALALEAPAWEAGQFRLRLEGDSEGVRFRGGERAPELPEAGMCYRGAVLATRDYLEKNRAEGVLVGLSGGIDSALTLAIAHDAIGAEQVEAVMMPSRHTRRISLEYAREQAALLDVRYRELDIDEAVAALDKTAGEGFTGVAAENLQSRVRGLLLMGLSNQTGAMVLATGNKSELAVGYATLYGDMVGAFAPLCDVTKTRVFAMARWRNGQSPAIPEAVIQRAPSAELRADQYDTDSLPDYAVLDPLLEALTEDDLPIETLVAQGYEESLVRRVAGMIRASEYKRRQGPPGPRLSRRGLVGDRRYPVTNGFRGWNRSGKN